MICGQYKIDLACAYNKPEGFIGVDISDVSDADIIHDLRKGLPFCSNSADIIRAYNFLEHLTNDQFIDLMWEVWRVLNNGGTTDFLVPKGNTDKHIKDPTHRHNGFSKNTFDYFRATTERQRQYNLPPFKNIEIREEGSLIYCKMEAVKN